MIKPPSTCLDILTDITLEYEEATRHRQYQKVKGTVPSSKSFVFYPNKVFRPFLVVRHTVNVVACLDNFGFLMAILEDDPMTCYNAKRSTAPVHFHTTVQAFLDCKFPPGHLMILILHHLVSSSGRYRKDGKFHQCSPLCWNLLAEHKLLQLVTPPMLTDVWTEPSCRYSTCLVTQDCHHWTCVNCHVQVTKTCLLCCASSFLSNTTLKLFTFQDSSCVTFSTLLKPVYMLPQCRNHCEVFWWNQTTV